MTEQELDTIIRLIPLATLRQTEIISGQIDIHFRLERMKCQNGTDFEGSIEKMLENDGRHK